MEPNGTGRRPPHRFPSYAVHEMLECLENLSNDSDSDNLLSDDDDSPYAGSRSSSNSSSSESETDYDYARSKSKCSNRGALPTTQSEKHHRFYTSMPLLKHLKTRGFYYTGSVDVRRNDFPPEIKTLKLDFLKIKRYLFEAD
ncbi:hypothetical protein RRG08_065467 [Elysia crispata]|uniref:Uncharacterized protein n=1 Tax=Elysia crispata TaxID=231223 RepID=A0AAE1BC05_9GAST|nr:hypothetical protein RRG08_065467 [Elysia crispata]